MTKQTVEITYHDPEKEKPARFYPSDVSIIVLGYYAGLWIPVAFNFAERCWFAKESGLPITLTTWIDPVPPPPKKKVWVKKEANCVGCLGNILGSAIDNVTFRIPGFARNIICTYEIEEEQP